jgi:hypothetical protein
MAMSRRRLDANGRPTYRTATAAEEAGAIPPPWCGGRLHRIVRRRASSRRLLPVRILLLFHFPRSLARTAPLPSLYHVSPLRRSTSPSATSGAHPCPSSYPHFLSNLLPFHSASICPTSPTPHLVPAPNPIPAANPTHSSPTSLPNPDPPPCAMGRVAQVRNPSSPIPRTKVRPLAP